MRTAGLIAIVTCLALPARADDVPPLSDLHGRDSPVEDLAPRVTPTVIDPSDATLSVSVSTKHNRSERGDRRDYAGSILFAVPTDFFLMTQKAKTNVSRKDGGDDVPSHASPPGDRASPRSDGTAPPGGPLMPSLVRSRDARDAIDAAIRAASIPVRTGELDAMASRARYSALLPEVRLRATRLIDESTSLSPTSYDAARTTASGGSSLWLEARTTWSLDRLLFADEEVRIARLQHQVRDDATEVRRRVLDLLFAWQRALHFIEDPITPPHKCITLTLESEQLAIELDITTAGWFNRWRRRRTLPACEDHMRDGGITDDLPVN